MKINFERKNFWEVATRLREHKIRHGPIHRDGNMYSCQLMNNYNQALFSYLVLSDKIQLDE